jgi:hypothetical protein
MRLNHILFTPLLWLVSTPLLAASLPEVSEKSCANSQIISPSVARNKSVECRYTFRADAKQRPRIVLEVASPEGRKRITLADVRGKGEVLIPVNFLLDNTANEIKLVYQDNQRTRVIQTFYIRPRR